MTDHLEPSAAEERLYVRAATAAHLCDCSEDFIRGLPVDEVPPRRVNRNMVLYAVADLVRYFDRFKAA